MSQPPLFTRRTFLGSSLAAVSAAASMPLFLQRSAMAMHDPQQKPRDDSQRILVVVQLTGGNDGLNTIVPFQDDAYYRARPRIAVARDEVLRFGQNVSVGAHPSLAAVKAMYDQGLAGVVQNVGYPNPNRSHFVSMDIWHTADPAGGRGHGWLGKACDHLAEAGDGAPDPAMMIAIGAEAPLAGSGRRIKAVTFENPALFRWVGGDLHPALGEGYDQFNRAGVITSAVQGAAGADDQAAFIMRTALDAQIASDRVRGAVAKGPQTPFPRSGLASQLQNVAAMIRAELPTRVFYVTHGGFDTHANQPGSHPRRLQEFGEAVEAFYRELASLGQQERVLTLAFSEFGRRVAQNASNGTDHGTAGPVFLFGPMVQPGVLGSAPNLTRLDNGDLIYETDFRSVYSAILDRWLGVHSEAVLGRSYRPADVLRA